MMETIGLRQEKKMTDTAYVHAVTGLTDADHERLVRFYFRLLPEERIAVHGLHTMISRKRSGQKDRTHGSAYYYATFLLAVREYKSAQNPQLSKRMTIKKAAQIDALRMIREKAGAGRKPSATQLLVEENYNLIKTLRGGEPRPESWRSIAKKLSGEGRRISHTALKDIYERLEAEGGP